MKKEELYEKIISDLAEERISWLVNRCISELQKHRECLSGDDSGLTNVWNEICVQVQYEESSFWDSYKEFIRSTISEKSKNLKDYEELSIWLQSDEGLDWAYDDDKTESPLPHIEDYILACILDKAGSWSNKEIRKFLDLDDE